MMKKNIWIAAIMAITACCVAVGIFYHVFGFFTRFVRGSEEQALEAFSSVSVDADRMDLSITEGDGFYLSCQYADGEEPAYAVEDGILFIGQKESRSGFGIWGKNEFISKCSLSLTIPARTVLDRVEGKVALGDIRMEGITVLKCDMRSELGSLDIKRCVLGESDFGTDLGGLSISDTNLGDAKLSSDLGNIGLRGCTFGDLSICAALGNVSVDAAQDLDGYRVELRSDLGRVTVNGRHESGGYHQPGLSGGRTLEIENDMGSVKLDYKY